MLIICQIDWRELGVAFELQCLRNCTLSNFIKLIGLMIIFQHVKERVMALSARLESRSGTVTSKRIFTVHV